jgi:cell division protein FtsB
MRPRVLLALAAAIAMAVVVYTVVAPSGLPGLFALQKEEEALSKDVAEAKEKNAKLTDDVRILQGEAPESRAVLEKKAREELGMVHKDEVVLTVPK